MHFFHKNTYQNISIFSLRKILSYSIFSLLVVLVSIPFSDVYAQNNWWERGSTPIKILEKVRDKANNDRWYEIQDTALDNIMENAPKTNPYRIHSTLELVRRKINVYLQWMMYIGLSVATILLIYNGFLMVTGAFHKSWDFSEVKKNVSRIIVWVLIMSAFWAIVKLILAAVNLIFALE